LGEGFFAFKFKVARKTDWNFKPPSNALSGHP